MQGYKRLNVGKGIAHHVSGVDVGFRVHFAVELEEIYYFDLVLDFFFRYLPFAWHLYLCSQFGVLVKHPVYL